MKERKVKRERREVKGGQIPYLSDSLDRSSSSSSSSDEDFLIS